MHKNNFDFLRLVFSIFVIITHSYALTGLPEEDILYNNTEGQLSLSSLGVSGFFVISGYLIYQSLQRSTNIAEYFWKRFLRLFPALVVVLFLSIFLLSAVYEGSENYWTQKSVWTYFPKNISLYFIQFTISGVFENNPFPGMINGSLWTIAYEFTCYCLLGLLIFIPTNFKKNILIVIFSLFLVIRLVGGDHLEKYNFVLNAQNFIHLTLLFLGGALIAEFNTILQIQKKSFLVILSIAILVIICGLGVYSIFQYIVLPFVIISSGLQSTRFINGLTKKIGDLSYGIYIYAFPVQQTLVYYFKPHLFELMIYTTLITCTMGFLSWHLIEKRCLKLKSLNDEIFKKIFAFNSIKKGIDI